MSVAVDRGALPKKHYKLLRDPEDFHESQQQLQQAEPAPAEEQQPSTEQEPCKETVHTAQREYFPDDVWEAATLAPDDGAAVLKSYREVVHLRYVGTGSDERCGSVRMHLCVRLHLS